MASIGWEVVGYIIMQVEACTRGRMKLPSNGVRRVAI